MRNLTAKQLAEASGRAVQARVRVLLDVTATGALQDMTSYLGADWLRQVEVTDSVDTPMASATVILRRSSFGLNLSPLVQMAQPNQQPLGTYLPALMVRRALRVEACALPSDAVLLPTDWQNIFEGTVVSVDPGGAEAQVKLSCVDRAGLLNDTFIETQRVYGSAFPGTPVETVMQAILNDNINTPGLGSVTLYAPVSPGFNIVPYIQQKETVLDALRKLAQQIGWECKYRWDPASTSWRLTLYSPPRGKTVPDWTFARDDVIGPSQLSLSAVNVRNRVKVVYTDKSVTPNLRTNVLVNDAASQLKYGLRYMEAAEDGSSQIDTAAEAVQFANAMLADLREPLVDFGTEQMPWLAVETGDLYRYAAEPELYDAPQDLAVSTWRHRFDEASVRTSLGLRGKPSGGLTRWLRMEARTGVAPTADFDATGTPYASTQPTLGGVIVTYDDPQLLSPPVADWRTSECHVDGPYDTPPGGDFTPSAATLKEIGRTTRFEITNLVPGKYYRVKVVVVDLRGNRHTATAVLTQASVLVGPYNTNLATEAGNLLPNADFEVTTLPNDFTTTPPDNWETGYVSGAGVNTPDPTLWGAAARIYRDTTAGNNQTGQVAIRFNNAALGAGKNLPFIRTQSLPLTADKVYRFAALFKTDTAAKTPIIAIRSYDSAGVQVGLFAVSGALPVPVNTWYQASYTFRTPATARSHRAYFHDQTNTAGLLHLDKWEFFKDFPYWFHSQISDPSAYASGAYTRVVNNVPGPPGGPGPSDRTAGADFSTNYPDLTIRETGSYNFNGVLQLLAFPINRIMRLALFRNGVEYMRGAEVKQSLNGTPLTASLNVVSANFTQGDVIGFYVYHDAGSAKNSTADWRQHFYAGQRIA